MPASQAARSVAGILAEDPTISAAQLRDRLAAALPCACDEATSALESLVADGWLHVIAGETGGVADDGWPELLPARGLRALVLAADAADAQTRNLHCCSTVA